jgi:hypothetical protein
LGPVPPGNASWIASSISSNASCKSLTVLDANA